ncbi:MAG: transglutaminase-like domain-containing protein [Clostridiales bacterium]|nr:transglutaminase-like domain-containing protein [Clostridiales bacterium]
MEKPNQELINQKEPLFSLERVMDACCCFFLSVGILYAIFKILIPGPQIPGAIWLYPALFITIIFLCKSRMVIAVAAGAVLFLLYSMVRDLEWLNTVFAFLQWWVNDFTPPNADFYYCFYIIIRMLYTGAVTLILWILVRKHIPFWLLFLGCPAVVALFAYFGWRGFLPSMYCFSVGLMPLAAASTIKYERKAQGLAKAYAFTIAVFILGLTFLLLPSDTSSWRWQPFGDKVEEWRETARVYYWSWRTKNEPLPAFDLGDEYNILLGGSATPANIRMMLVRTNEPMLLKGSVYEYYTGHGWLKSIHHQAPPLWWPNAPDSSAADNSYTETIDLQSPEYDADVLETILGRIPQPGDDHPLAPFVKPFSAEITLLHPNESRLFYGGRPDSFYSANNILPFFERNTELKSSLPLFASYSYYLSGLMLDRTASGFSATMAEMSLLNEHPDNISITFARYYAAQSDNYSLQLPSIFVLANEFPDASKMTFEIANAGLQEGERRCKYEQALLLEEWLKKNCNYTLNPTIAPENKDFVLHFLETREGYCTYYATAMVIMARLVKIPARYVTGFALRPIAADQYEANQMTAHAWAELYFDNVGWLAFDPTGLSDFIEDPLPFRNDGEYRDYLDTDFFRNATERSTNKPSLFLTLILPIMIAIIAILLLVLIIRQAKTAFKLPRLLKKYSKSHALDIYYRDLLGQLSILGWQYRPKETVMVFTKRMSGYIQRHYRALQDLGTAVCDWRYGGLPPNEYSLNAAATLHEYFENLLRRELKGVRYYVYRLKHRPKL